MVKHTIIHLKSDCINCGACAAICPDFWEMDEEARAQLKCSKETNGCQELEICSEESRAINQEAANCCPVNIIHIKKKEVELSVPKP